MEGPPTPSARLLFVSDPQESPRDDSLEESSGHAVRRPYIRSIVFLVVAAVSLYLLLPSLVSVFSSWRSLEHLGWPFAVLVLLFEAASSVCLWEVDRIALGFNGWFPVACSQLAGNALGRIVPGSATPFTVVMLRKSRVRRR